MAILDDEIAKRRAEDALIGDKADVSTDDLSEDVPDTSEEDKPSSPAAVYQPATKNSPSYVLVPLKADAPPLDTKTDEQVVAPTRAPSSAPLETKTDEQVMAPLDKGEAPTTLPQVEKGQLVQPPQALDKGEAPAQLDQVERATLVKPPAPDLGERGTPIPEAPKAELVDPDPDSLYTGDTTTQPAPAGVRPQTQPVTPSPEAAPVAPPQRQTSLGLTPDEYKAQYVNPPTGTAAQPSVATADAGGLNINTDYTADSNSSAKGRGGDGQVHGIVLHSSDGRESGDINQLTHGGVSAHYYVTTDGRIYNLVPEGDTAYHAGQTRGQYANYNNSNTIGIEQEHYDPGGKGGANGEAWSPAQVAATAKLVSYLKGKYGLSDNDIMGHSDVAPERKQDPYNYPWQGFFAAVDSSTGAPAATGAQPTVASGGKAQAAGVGPAVTGKATTFGYNDPQDSGVGAPKLGQLDINNRDLIGAAIPEEALRAYIGANPGSWRTARVQVTGANGQQVMVPIVDLGPRDTSDQRGVVADFTQGLTDLTGNKGDQNFGFRIIPNAGPDVMKDPQAFADEQAAIKAGINTGARFQAPAAKKPSYVLAPMAPKSPQQQQAEQFAAQGQTNTLDELNRNTENPGQFWKMLQQPMPGTVDPASGQPVGQVSDAARTAYADNFKQELTKYAQDFYNEPDPNKAFQRAVGDANLGTFGQDVGRAATGVVGQVDVGINKMSRDSDNNALDRFAQVLHPESDGPGRAAFIKTLTDIQDPNLRAQTIGKLWANLDPDKQASIDINGLVNSADNVANPAFQAGQAKEIAAKDAFIQKLFTPDPTVRGTAGAWATPIGQMVGNTAMAFLPKILQTSAFASQIYGATRDRVKEEHPDWTDAQIAQNAGTSTFAQLAPQEALIAASHGIMGPIARWGANPVIRFGIGGGVHLATGAAGGALMQAGANVAEGQPIGQDVGSAAIQGAIQAAPFAVHGAVSGAMTRPEEAPVVSPEAIPKVNQAAPLGEETAAPPPPTTGPAGGTVHGATAETMASGGEEPSRPATPQGANVPPTPPLPVDRPSPLSPIPEEVSPHEPAQPQPLPADQLGQVSQPAAEELTGNMPRARITYGNESRTSTPEEPTPDRTPALDYTQSQNIPKPLGDLVQNDSLKDAATAAASKIDNPIARDIAQHVARLVPEDAKVGVADFTQPVTAGGKEYSGQVSAGLYHPDSKTALISDQTNNPVGSIVHEATHAALNEAITNPKALSPEAQAGVAQIHDAYQKALRAAPSRQPTWIGYGLSSPEEFTSAAVSDPRFQRWLKAISSAPERPNVIQSMFQGAGKILGLKHNTPNSLYERTLSGIAAVDAVPHETRTQGPIYAANPFSVASRSGLPHWLKTTTRAARQFSTTMRDNLNATPETRGLSRLMDLADDRKDALFGQRAQMATEIKRLAKGKEEEIEHEFARMAEQVDKGQVPNSANPTVNKIWQRFTQVKGEDAQFMRDNNFHVQLPDGTWRPFIGMRDPSMYVARSMREDVTEALRAPRDPNGNYTPEFIKLFNEGLQKGFFQKPEDLEAYVSHIGQGLTQGPRSTSLETARTVKMPSFFFDYTLDGQLRNIYQSSDTRARLEAFGQSRPGVPDQFQKTIENINASTNLTTRQKQIAAANAQLARDDWYHQNSLGVYRASVAGAKSLASVIQTGNWFTSAKVGIGRLFFSMQNTGVLNTGRALISTLRHFGSSRDTARDLGIIKDMISFEHEDLWAPGNAYKKFRIMQKAVMEVSGHSEASRFVNTVDMKASQLWLAGALREIANKPNSTASRMAREIIERRGVDLGKLQAGSIPETRTFLRQWVNDAQTSYRLMDLPVWSKTWWGHLGFTYQHWAYNATRMLLKETVNPAIAAFGRGDAALGTRYMGRLVYFAAAAAGAEEITKAIREWIFGRETTTASWSQFWNAVNQKDNGRAISLIGNRLMDELVGGTFLGMAGDYARGAMLYSTGKNEVANVWHPDQPPALSMAKSIAGLADTFHKQGQLSDRDWANFWGQMFSGGRELKNIVQSGAIHLEEAGGPHLPIPGLSEAKGYRERNFAQAKFRQFTNDNPNFKKPDVVFPPGPKTAYYANIEDALYAGNADKAKQIMAQMKADKADIFDIKAIKQSMGLRAPIPGGKDGMAFRQWAAGTPGHPGVLSDEELSRIYDAQNAYNQTAAKAGIYSAKDFRTHAVGGANLKGKALQKAIVEMKLIND